MTFCARILSTAALVAVFACGLPASSIAAPKAGKLDAKAVKKNELLDRKFLDLYARAIQNLLRRDVNTAYTLIQAAQKLRPTSPRLYALYGAMYKLNKQYKEAIKFFKVAAEKFDTKTEIYEKLSALYNIAFCYELGKDRTSAIAAWQSYISVASSYPKDAKHVTFARQRTKDLAKVQGPKKK